MCLSVVKGIGLPEGEKMRVCGHCQDGLDVHSEGCSYLSSTRWEAFREGSWLVCSETSLMVCYVLNINIPVALDTLSLIMVVLLKFS